MEKKYRVYIGSFDQWIHYLNMDEETGELTYAGNLGGQEHASFFCDGQVGGERVLYACLEVTEFQGQYGGAVGSYRMEEDGSLTTLSKQRTFGERPCSIALSATGRALCAVNYDEGTLCYYKVDEKGAIQPDPIIIKHEGSSTHPIRQIHPYAHGVALTPDGGYFCVTDLGMDAVMLYKAEADGSAIKLHQQLKMPDGRGCRNVIFSPDGRFAYVVTEIGGDIYVFSYDGEAGKLEQIQTISCVRDDYEKPEASAAIARLTPNGEYLYLSIRNDNAICCLKVDQKSGMLQKLRVQPASGGLIRGLEITPNGRFLIAPYMYGDYTESLRINYGDGTLEPVSRVDTAKMSASAHVPSGFWV